MSPYNIVPFQINPLLLNLKIQMLNCKRVMIKTWHQIQNKLDSKIKVSK